MTAAVIAGVTLNTRYQARLARVTPLPMVPLSPLDAEQATLWARRRSRTAPVPLPLA